MCDVRFAAAGAKFAAVFARRGLIAEYGISWILPRLTGWGVALDLLLSGRTFLAEEAAELGLVKEVVAPENLMKRAPRLRRGHRRELLAGFDGGDQAAGIRRRHARCRGSQLAGRGLAARVDAAAGRHRGDHQLLREATAAIFPSLDRDGRVGVPERTIMSNLDYQAIDVDNHYYEPLDSFTRHLRQEVPQPRRADVQRRQAHPGDHRRPGQPLHPQPDLRSDHRAGLPGPVVPRRDSRRRRSGIADEGRAAGRCNRNTRTGTPGSR